jgi:hypothetical protein
MGKRASKKDSKPIKNELRREKIQKLKGDKEKGSLPFGLFLEGKSKKKLRQEAKYLGHVKRREAELQAQASATTSGGMS